MPKILILTLFCISLFFESKSVAGTLSSIPDDVCYHWPPETLMELKQTSHTNRKKIQRLFNQETYRKAYPRFWVEQNKQFRLGQTHDLLSHYIEASEKIFLEKNFEGFDALSEETLSHVKEILSRQKPIANIYMRMSLFLVTANLNKGLQNLKNIFSDNLFSTTWGGYKEHIALFSRFIHSEFHQTNTKISTSKTSRYRHVVLHERTTIQRNILNRLWKSHKWKIETKTKLVGLRQRPSVFSYSKPHITKFKFTYYDNDFFNTVIINHIKKLQRFTLENSELMQKHCDNIIFLILLEKLSDLETRKTVSKIQHDLDKNLSSHIIGRLFLAAYFTPDNGSSDATQMHRALYDFLTSSNSASA